MSNLLFLRLHWDCTDDVTLLMLRIAPALLEELKNSTDPVPKKLDSKAGE